MLGDFSAGAGAGAGAETAGSVGWGIRVGLGCGVVGSSTALLLLASLLRDLGFGVALFEFKSEQHMAVGIACPAGYDYAGTGYAFIESTETSIITDSNGTYAGIGRLSSTPVVIPIASGSAARQRWRRAR